MAVACLARQQADKQVQLVMPCRRDHEVGVFDVRLLQNRVARTVSGEAHHVIPVAELVHHLVDLVDHRNIMPFAAQVRDQSLANLASAYNYYFHTLFSPVSENLSRMTAGLHRSLVTVPAMCPSNGFEHLKPGMRHIPGCNTKFYTS